MDGRLARVSVDLSSTRHGSTVNSEVEALGFLETKDLDTEIRLTSFAEPSCDLMSEEQGEV